MGLLSKNFVTKREVCLIELSVALTIMEWVAELDEDVFRRLLAGIECLRKLIFDIVGTRSVGHFCGGLEE